MKTNKTELILEESINYIDSMINELAKNSERVLNIISLSEDPASASYMKNKCKMGEKYGIKTIIHKPENKSDLNNLIEKLSMDKNNRVIIQYPFDEKEWGTMYELMKKIPTYMDVDGFTFNNLDLINTKSFDNMINNPTFSPTAKGVITLIKFCLLHSVKEFKGTQVTVIGKGLTSGLPIATMCEQLGCTVTWCNSKTSIEFRDISIANSNIIISCAGTGREDIVKQTNTSLRYDACYINVGMARNEEGKLKGDIDYKVISELNNTLFCNPLTNSTGKLTTMCLILNTIL